jgi:primosomal protein N' (replication factor Y) (superfamily II helicase)
MSQPPLIQVALNIPFAPRLDYFLPDTIPLSRIQAGQRIKVPFRGAEKIGIVLSQHQTTHFPISKIKAAIALLDESPLINQELLHLAYWIADYYHATLGEVFNVILPAHIKQGEQISLSKESYWKIVDNLPTKLVLTPAQQIAFTQLSHHPDGLSTETCTLLNIRESTLKRLAEKNYICAEKHAPSDIPLEILSSNITLNNEQKNAIDTIACHLDSYKTWVLDGVTGSGKTEVYLQLIEKLLQQDKQALVLIPEIGLTPQTIQRFSARFKTTLVFLHSGLNDTQRTQAWLAAEKGIAKIVIGTRSAVFTPMPKLGIIIVDEAHDSSFKQQDRLRYHARDIAIKRAQLNKIPIVLGSATHALETLYNVERNRFSIIRLHARTGQAQMPSFELFDIRNQPLKEGISPIILEKIQEKIKHQEQVLIYLNRRGFAPILMCHHCGWMAECTHCDARLTYHIDPVHLRCHHCDTQTQIVSCCPTCRGRNLIPIGLGTVKVENVLTEAFPTANILRIDRDSTRKKNAMEDLINTIHTKKVDILIGTQMLAKGHHFPRVTLVIILDGDAGFFSADFRATEQFAQTLVQVAGRAGRAEKTGHVIIQTRNPTHPDLNHLIQLGYWEFAHKLLHEREQAKLPPSTAMAIIRAQNKYTKKLDEFLSQIKMLAIKKHTSMIHLVGPLPSPMYKRAGNYHKQLIIQAKDKMTLKNFLNELMIEIETLPLNRKIKWSLDVDPIDLS